MSHYVFLFLSLLSILCAMAVIFARNPIYSVMYLILCFFSIAGHYVLLNAQFLAIVHIIVYSGAIMVLFLFTVMLLNLNADSETHKPLLLKFAAVIAGGTLMITLLATFRNAEILQTTDPINAQLGLVKNLGHVLFTDFVLPFEISSVLFIAAMVGAVILAKKELN
ncbi:MAG: NADH-quinone oxidoreductase subunit J [Bacteroidia bacterium]|jgi:NADH-quinone oxidoreductase subunit J|nr:NADH-quinone oxidoreductase subunit J [Bacteroidia bacterium]